VSRAPESNEAARDDPRAAVAEIPLWYHTLELAPDVVTPGWFDLRPVVDLMPWPDVRGKRCLDIGTYDGFLAFELERRGAAEVVATDIGSHEEWDWPPRIAARGPVAQAQLAGSDKGAGFPVAKRLLGSSVDRVTVSIYELDPAELGTFDVVVCGTLLLHLRDPLRALERVRSVCRGAFLSAEQVDLPLAVLQPGRPAQRLDGTSELVQWTIPNPTAHAQMLAAAGFGVERRSRLYSIPFGAAHPARRGARAALVSAGRRLLTRTDGVPHHAALARV
jgi:tRNA (mo5U34)-methyltransferase